MLDKYTCDKCGYTFDTPQHELGCTRAEEFKSITVTPKFDWSDACGIRDDFEYYKWLDEEVAKEQEEWYVTDIGLGLGNVVSPHLGVRDDDNI